MQTSIRYRGRALLDLEIFMPNGSHTADTVISSGQTNRWREESWYENDLVRSGGILVQNTLSSDGGVLVSSAGATTSGANQKSGRPEEDAFGEAGLHTVVPNSRGPVYPTSTYIISSGQTSSGLVEGYHGLAYWNEIVLGGGTAVQNQVTASGHVYVSSGGLTQSDTISSGGFEVVSAGGSAYESTVSSGAVLEGGGTVVAGDVYGLLSGVDVGRNGPGFFAFTDVESGGVASSVTVIDNAALDLQGGVAISTTVLDGSLYLVFGGLEQNAYLSGSSAYMDVGSGCSAYYDIVMGGTMVVESGLESQSRPAAAYTYIAGGGVLSNADVVEGAAVAAGGLLANSAYAYDTEVDAGGVLYDSLVNTYFLSGSLYSTVGGADFETVVSSGGALKVEDSSSGGDIQSGGLLSIQETEFLLSGSAVYVYGSASSTQVEAGGTVVINDTATTLVWNNSNPAPSFLDGSTFYSGSVLSYAHVDFTSNYTDSGTLSGTFGASSGQNTFSGTTLEIGSAMIEGGAAVVLDGATLGAVTISNGGILYLGSGTVATVNDATVLAGGLLQGDLSDQSTDDLQGSTEVYGVVLTAYLGADGPATLTVQSGGLADTVLMAYDGASVMTVLSGGSATVISLSERDTLSVASGGMVSGTTLGENAVAYIYGTAIDTTVELVGDIQGGGEMIVVGTASGVQVNYGGTLDDEYGGSVSGVRVSNGGVFIAESDTPALGVTVLAGGVVDLYGAILYSGASRTLAGTLQGGGSLIEDGPGSLVMNAATTSGFTGEIVLSAGTVELARKGEAARAGVVFAENGKFATLQVDVADRPTAGTSFATVLSNFDNADDRLDLAGLAFVSGARATVSGGVLTLKDGGYSAAFGLSGTKATKYTVISDGKGGTLIHAAVGAGTQAIAEAAAAFAPQGQATAPSSGRHVHDARIDLTSAEAGCIRHPTG